MLRNFILTVFCWIANRQQPTYMVYACTALDPEPQEIKECDSLREAVLYIRKHEGREHHDRIAYWAENGLDMIMHDSRTYITGD